ncbi:MAG: phytoene desaturase family protein [Planctomycetota bacterium]
MVSPANAPANSKPVTSEKVVVVGGGLAGLACAVDLSSRGFRVTIVEQNHHLGGKMNVLEQDGFAFDMGPTILTLPEVFCGIARRAGKKPEELVEFVRLDPQWRCMYEDGTVIDLRDTPDEMVSDLAKQFPGTDAASGFEKFLAFSRRMQRLSRKVFYYKDVASIGDVMRQTPLGDPAIGMDAARMRLHSTVGATAHKMVGEPHVRQMIEHFLQYVGSSPFLAPAVLSLIASAQQDEGCWYSMGGTRSIARALTKLAEDAGVEAITGKRVTRILDNNGAVAGVELEGGETVQATKVVSNCDVQRTLTDLVATPGAKARQKKVAGSYRPACSGLVLYLGLDRQYDHLAHHDFLFSGDSHAEFSDIYEKQIPARDPTIYLCVPSRTDPNQAPAGGEALYALIHTPANPGSRARWENEGGLLEQYRPVVIDKLKRFGMEDLEEHIVVERHLTPDSIDRMYNAEGGAIYGLASHGRLKGGFKPNNRSKVLDGLYLAGGSVNPGPGVPMVLMSGVTAARALCDDLGLDTSDIDTTSGAPEVFRRASSVGAAEPAIA